MGTELTMFNEAQRPAHLDSAFTESNIESRSSVPSLALTGKVWAVVINGERTPIQTKTADGDKVPLTIFKGIILDYAKRRGRSYYEGTYDADQTSAPVCWSDDGIKPYDNVPKKQAPKCDGCPRSIKGSKVVGDKQFTECAQHRLLAITPAFQIGKFPALRLKIAVTSDFDKQSNSAAQRAQEHWFPFQQYMDFLKTKGVKHSAELVTKIMFDPEAAYPKLFFSPDRWLEPAETQVILGMVKDEETTKLLGTSWTPAGDSTALEDQSAGNAVEAAEQTTATVAEASQPATGATETVTHDEEVVLEGLDAPAPEAKQEPAQAEVEPEVIVQTPDPKPAAEKAAEATPAASTNVDASVADLLSEWT
jgi:hypothetical protein